MQSVFHRPPIALLLACLVCLAGCQSYYRKVDQRENPGQKAPVFRAVPVPDPGQPGQPPAGAPKLEPQPGPAPALEPKPAE